MATKIRLRRMGAKKSPYYRVVVADSRAPRDGKCIEEIGFYHPISKDVDLKINEERALYWLNTGAQPSETVKQLLKRAGISKQTTNV